MVAAADFRAKTDSAMRQVWLEYRAERCEQTGVDIDRGVVRQVWRCADPDHFVVDGGSGVPEQVSHLFRDERRRAKCRARVELLPWTPSCAQRL